INHGIRTDTAGNNSKKLHISAVPAAGYTMLTGLAGIIAANGAFSIGGSSQSNVSNVLTSITYSQYRQIIFPIQSNIWTKNNKYNIFTDWRYLSYPSYTYGLGGRSKLKNIDSLDYSYVRFYQTVSRYIAPNLYLGIGYDYDYLWNIVEIDPPEGKKTSFERYGYTPTEVASGITLNLLYDNRKNSINPDQGYYAHAVYRSNLTFLGSSNDWSSLQIDLRHYIKFPASTNNVLAFWNFDWLTLGGKPPYLLLPATGWDTYNNTGRGYVQGRFRGKDMIYLESEYRFAITRNGLLGGVVFANAESFARRIYNEGNVIDPGAGLGIRLKLNKFSKTNLALDYGFGTEGSRGFAVNLGEVF
ncbi:MAG: BamA/TamA family outer membrane protein, partial [Chitinophagaceae bacterium]